ncbi:MAG: dipeptidase [Planctomycetota bacterium]
MSPIPSSTRALPDPVAKKIQDDSERHLEELCAWLRIPSVSSSSAHVDDMLAAATWLESKLTNAGLQTKRIETNGFPMIYAETPAVDGAPVALVYGHYDVQPAEPLELWNSPAFEPTLRDGNVYARGATDDKGQVLTHIHAVCDWMQSGEPLPMQIKFLIEGEEEVGSANLEAYLPDARDLSCDVVVVSDSSQYAEGLPAMTCGLRGIATYEIKVTGPSHDLHSGSFGGAVANPAIALSQLLASMMDQSGRIQIKGFYDDVQPIPDAERAAWRQLPSDEPQMRAESGVEALHGESGFTTDERRWARPTFDVNGITSGHQGEGVKTIIPSWASAKFSFRLVPNQVPDAITQAVQEHIAALDLPGVQIELLPDHGASAMVTKSDSPYAIAASRAIESAFGVVPVPIREGGSIPILADFQRHLGCDVLLLGWGQNDDAMHSPNEKFSVADFHRGTLASAHLWAELAADS